MPHPCINARIEDLDTPALLLDLDAAQRNIARMADFFADRPCKLRPHFKNHKCTTLMRLQVQRSAVGVTCAKLGEAEVLARAGFSDILLANQVVGAAKIERLLALPPEVTLRVAVDSEENCRQLSEMATRAGRVIPCLVEVDVGMGRCGVPPGEAAVALARLVQRLPGLRLDGLQAYEGHAVYVNSPKERAAAARAAMGLALETAEAMRAAGLQVNIISGGGTGTYDVTGDMAGVGEVQAGTYVTMDWRYHQVRPEFEIALSVLVTCLSVSGGRAVLDVGVKGAGAEFGPPMIRDRPDMVIPAFRSEEHCICQVSGPPPRVGEKLQLIPSHACTTCNLYRELYVHQDGRVVDVWPIEASGLLR